mgnify:CR=1 FL=1
MDRIVTDTLTISVANVSIASYDNGKISGLAEGTTTLTASLYGMTAANMPTVSVHESGDKDNTDKDQKETETKDSDKDQKETEVKDQDKNQQQTGTPNTKPNQDQNQKPQTRKKNGCRQQKFRWTIVQTTVQAGGWDSASIHGQDLEKAIKHMN